MRCDHTVAADTVRVSGRRQHGRVVAAVGARVERLLDPREERRDLPGRHRLGGAGFELVGGQRCEALLVEPLGLRTGSAARRTAVSRRAGAQRLPHRTPAGLIDVFAVGVEGGGERGGVEIEMRVRVSELCCYASNNAGISRRVARHRFGVDVALLDPLLAPCGVRAVWVGSLLRACVPAAAAFPDLAGLAGRRRRRRRRRRRDRRPNRRPVRIAVRVGARLRIAGRPGRRGRRRLGRGRRPLRGRRRRGSGGRSGAVRPAVRTRRLGSGRRRLGSGGGGW